MLVFLKYIKVSKIKKTAAALTIAAVNILNMTISITTKTRHTMHIILSIEFNRYTFLRNNFV